MFIEFVFLLEHNLYQKYLLQTRDRDPMLGAFEASFSALIILFIILTYSLNALPTYLPTYLSTYLPLLTYRTTHYSDETGSILLPDY